MNDGDGETLSDPQRHCITVVLAALLFRLYLDELAARSTLGQRHRDLGCSWVSLMTISPRGLLQVSIRAAIGSRLCGRRLSSQCQLGLVSAVSMYCHPSYGDSSTDVTIRGAPPLPKRLTITETQSARRSVDDAPW